ncbi:MAG: dihydropteroate synthase [Comamonadaceae bacterium]
MKWNTTRFLLDLTSPKVMGIVNVTPDSFSDGGQHATTVAALQHCEKLLQDGADILDIGGESSRPGARPVTLEEELARVLPVVRDAVKLGVPISVDSYKPKVMRAVLDLGVDIINDIYALRWTETLADINGHQIPAALNAMQVVSQHPACGVCLMHMHREPFSMQVAPMQGDVVSQVRVFLLRIALALEQQGVNKDRIVIDPGIGFGKTVAQNFALLSRQSELLSVGYPVLAGWSRKSSLATVIGTATGSGSTVEAQERMVASVAAALLAVERGASIVRVHDVRQTVLAIKVLGAIK